VSGPCGKPDAIRLTEIFTFLQYSRPFVVWVTYTDLRQPTTTDARGIMSASAERRDEKKGPIRHLRQFGGMREGVEIIAECHNGGLMCGAGTRREVSRHDAFEMCSSF
jgi:hypothetical protein